jgi:hypothetical protein
MALDVPEPVAEYLAAEEAKDADALSRCFTEDGTVHDEGQDYHGRYSIRQWKQAADSNTDTSCGWLTFKRSETW